MSDTSSSDGKKPVKQLNEDLPEAMGHISMDTNNSDKTSTPPKSLSNMPVDVVRPIIEKLDYRQQMKLRKVSKSLRTLVDRQKPNFKEIECNFWVDSVFLAWDNHHVLFTNHEYEYEEDEDDDLKVIRDDFLNAAFVDLASTLKNPRLKLEKLNVAVDDQHDNFNECYDKIRSILEPLNHQVSVETVELNVSNPAGLLSILPYLKPRVLKTIKLSFELIEDQKDWSGSSTEMDQIARLEQWKQAEEFRLGRSFANFPMEYAEHFKRIHITVDEIDEVKFEGIKEYISKLEHLEMYTLFGIKLFHPPPGPVYQWLGAPVSSNSSEEIFHHPIPDSNYFLEFKSLPGDLKIEITKKKRENID